MTAMRTIIVFTAALALTGCAIGEKLSQKVENALDDPSQGSTDEPVDFDGDSATDEPIAPVVAPEPVEPAPDPCPTGASVSLDVQLHTFLVNGSPNGFAVEGFFEWNAGGASDLTVDIEFKTSAMDWTQIASGLPVADVANIDLSQYAGPAGKWYFRAAARAPGCGKAVAHSSITTISNF